MERHLAFATLANVSQHPGCRRLVHTQSLTAGFLPPGVARAHHVPVAVPVAGGPRAAALVPADAPGAEEGDGGGNVDGRPAGGWAGAGPRPLYQRAAARHQAGGGVFAVAPSKPGGGGGAQVAPRLPARGAKGGLDDDAVALHVAR